MSESRTLDELGKVARGKSKHRPRNDPSLFGGKYPFIQTGDVKRSNFYITDYSQTYNEKGLAQSKLWDPGTLCITIAANIAETAILGIPACFPDSIIGFIPYKDKANVRFVKYCLETYKLQMQAISQGTTQDNLSLGKLLSIKFKIPKVDTQKKIAAILSAYDDLIENNNRRIALLEQTAEEIYCEWFVRKRFPGWRNSKFENGVPIGWEMKNLGEVCSVARGSSPRPIKDQKYFASGIIPWIKIADATASKMYIYETRQYINEFGASFSRKLPPGSLIIATSGTLGFCIFLGVEGCVHDGWMYLSDYQGLIEPTFMYYVINSYQDYLNNLSYGAAIQNINTGIMRGLSVTVPQDEVLKQFYSTIKPMHSKIDRLGKINKNLAKSRDLLLSRLISGRLPVDELDIHFPPCLIENEEPTHA